MLPKDVSLMKADRAYRKALEAWLDMYPEMRTTSEEEPDSAFRKRPVEGGEKIGGYKMQVARSRRDVGMAHQPLDDVDVLVPPYEARGIGVAIVITVTLRLAREPSGS